MMPLVRNERGCIGAFPGKLLSTSPRRSFKQFIIFDISCGGILVTVSPGEKSIGNIVLA